MFYLGQRFQLGTISSFTRLRMLAKRGRDATSKKKASCTPQGRTGTVCQMHQNSCLRDLCSYQINEKPQLTLASIESITRIISISKSKGWLPSTSLHTVFPGGSAVKNLPANAEAAGDAGLIPGSQRSPGGGDGSSPRYSCLGNSMDRGAWRATVHRVAELGTTEHANSLCVIIPFLLHHF